MIYKKRQIMKETSIPAIIGLGLTVGWIITILLTMIMTAVISSGDDKEYLIGISSILAVILSSFMTTFIISKNVNHKKMIFALIGGALYFISLLCVNTLFYDSTYSNVGYYALLITGASITAGLICSKKSSKKIRY